MPWLATGAKAGVCILPWGVEMTPVLAEEPFTEALIILSCFKIKWTEESVKYKINDSPKISSKISSNFTFDPLAPNLLLSGAGKDYVSI